MAPQITKVIHKKKEINDIAEGTTIQRLLQQVRYSKSNNHARVRLVQQETARGLFEWCCVISGKCVRQGYGQQDYKVKQKMA
jgi:dsRNA-specific ribonuclease